MELPMSNAAALQFDSLGDRAFSFYPPIVGVEHNGWEFQEARWSEVLVKNTKSGEEIWIPRNYLGEISKVDEPVMIVGLKRELEYKGGTVWPHSRRVIQMPASPASPRPEGEVPLPPPSPLSELRMGGTESGISKLIVAALAIGLVLTFAVVAFFRIKNTGGAVELEGVLQVDLGFTAASDYYDVVRKLGQPERDRWLSDEGERQYRALSYPKQDLVVFLMGLDRDNTQYIGAKDLRGRVVHYVSMPRGGSTAPILRSLKFNP
jgi:hypothetical protein